MYQTDEFTLEKKAVASLRMEQIGTELLTLRSKPVAAAVGGEGQHGTRSAAPNRDSGVHGDDKKSDRIATLNAVQLGHSRRGSAKIISRCGFRTCICHTVHMKWSLLKVSMLRNSLRLTYTNLVKECKGYVCFGKVQLKNMSLVASNFTLFPRLNLLFRFRSTIQQYPSLGFA